MSYRVKVRERKKNKGAMLSLYLEFMPQTAFEFDSVILTVVMKILNKITREFVFR